MIMLTLQRYTDPMVILLVGHLENKITVHRGVLEQSAWFKNALDGPFEEAKTGVIRMPEDDPDVVAVFVHWLYTKTVLRREGREWIEADKGYFDLARAYILGDKIAYDEHMDAVLSSIIDLEAKTVWSSCGLSVLKTVYRSIPSTSSPLKYYLVDEYLIQRHAKRTTFSKLENIPKEFLIDVMRIAIENDLIVVHPKWTDIKERKDCYVNANL